MEFLHSGDIENIEKVYSQAMADLSSCNIDYLVADSHYMKKMVTDKKKSTEDAFIFTTLVLPPLKLLSLKVAQCIVDFAKAGDHVYSIGSLPDASAENGADDPEMKKLMDNLTDSLTFYESKNGLKGLIKSNSPGLEPCVTFETGEFPLIATRRMMGKRIFFWLANNEDVKHEFVLRIADASGKASVWNCENGSIIDIFSETLPNGVNRVPLALNPGEAVWLVFDPEKTQQISKPTAVTEFETIKLLDDNWHLSIDKNDQPDLAQHQLLAPECLLNACEKSSLESWLHWGLREFSGFVDYRQAIKLDIVNGDEILDLGKVEYFAEVWINGVNVGSRLWPPFQFSVGPQLKQGNNTIHIKVGNLILNALTQYKNYNWKWHSAPTEKQLDAGLFGPVSLKQSS